MKTFLMTALLGTTAALVATSATAQTTLTFDGLTGTYYGSLGPQGDLTGDGQFVAYTESGYQLTLTTPNDPATFFGAHIGDATGIPQTFNWHDGGDNLGGAYVTLTKIGGGAFNLKSFDYTAFDTLTLSAAGYGSTGLASAFPGVNYAANFANVTSVTFSGASSYGLDNLQLSAGVPEPATWALMILGFGAVGGAMRRRNAAVKTSVRFA